MERTARALLINVIKKYVHRSHRFPDSFPEFILIGIL